MTVEERYANETISHSGLNAFSVSPRSYRRYKDYRDSQLTTASLSLGSAVHCYILEPDEFYDRYILAPKEVPTPMYRTFVETLVKTKPPQGIVYNDAQLHQWYDNAYKVAGFKNPGFKRVVERFTTEKAMQDYYKFLETLGEEKAPITEEDLSKVKTCKESTATHKLAAQLLYGFPLADRHAEIEILWQYPGYKFTMRSIIDALVVDRHNKRAYIIDLKTTSKSVHGFSYSFSLYSYHRQMYLYILATKHYLASLGENPRDYQIVPYIVAVQTKDNFESAVYMPDPGALKVAQEEVEILLGGMQWHFENNKWDFPQAYYEGDGSLIVGLNRDE